MDLFSVDWSQVSSSHSIIEEVQGVEGGAGAALDWPGGVKWTGILVWGGKTRQTREKMPANKMDL